MLIFIWEESDMDQIALFSVKSERNDLEAVRDLQEEHLEAQRFGRDLSFIQYHKFITHISE
jgi:hypothetical protein